MTAGSAAGAYDEVLEEIGGFGWWQRWVYLQVCFVSLCTAIPTVSQSFTLYEGRFRCVVDNCDTMGTNSPFEADFNSYAIPYWDDDGDYDETDEKEAASCTTYQYVGGGSCEPSDFNNATTVACSKHIFDDSDYELSFIADLDLATCPDEDEDWPLYPVISRNSLLGLGYATGMIFSGLIMGQLSDKLGRRHMMLVNQLGSFICMLVPAFIPNYWAFFSFRILAGMFSFGFSLAFMISVEVVSVKYRMILGILINVPFAVGEMVVALLSYLFQDWSDDQIAMSCVILCSCGIWFILPESPRWLLAEGKIDAVKKIFLKGAKMNKKPLSEEMLDKLAEMNQEAENEPQVEQLGFMSLFSEWKVAMITLIMWSNWIATTLSYYGLGFSSVNLSGDIYVSYFLSALIEIPSYVFCALVLDGWGRKSVLMCCQFLAGICCILAGVIEDDTATTVFSLAGKFGAAACFAIIYQYTAELYPTSIRTTAVGSSSMAGRVGSVLAPVIIVIEPASVPLVIMGVAALVGGVLAIFLPETLGMPFPEKIEDIYGLYKNKKKWYKWVSRSELKVLMEEAERQKLEEVKG